MINARGDTRTYGLEALLRYRWDEVTVTGSYVVTEGSESDPNGPGRRRVPLTPRHTASLVAVCEREDVGRLGLEAYYTGRQSLDDNPYRTTSKAYVLLGVMAERHFDRLSIFVNVENLADVRQSKTDAMILPRRAPDGGWTVDAWGPTDGRVANAGLRVRFGGGD